MQKLHPEGMAGPCAIVLLKSPFESIDFADLRVWLLGCVQAAETP